MVMMMPMQQPMGGYVGSDGFTTKGKGKGKGKNKGPRLPKKGDWQCKRKDCSAAADGQCIYADRLVCHVCNRPRKTCEFPPEGSMIKWAVEELEEKRPKSAAKTKNVPGAAPVTTRAEKRAKKKAARKARQEEGTAPPKKTEPTTAPPQAPTKE